MANVSHEYQWLAGKIGGLSGYVRDRYTSRAAVHVDSKRDPTDLLTEVDLTVQRRLIEAIEKEFPGDVVFAEEEGYDQFPMDADCRCWVIDPIDGTQNFVRGLFPAFAISAAFAEGGIARAGIVEMPIANKRFAAASDLPATCNGESIQVSDRASFGTARVELDFGDPDKRQLSLDRFRSAVTHSGEFRCLGSAAVGLCAVACGESDVYLHVGLHPWDYAAGALIVERAGGHVSRIDGRAATLFDDDQSVVATNGALHEEILGMTSQG